MNKKLILGFLSASLVAGFWACGTGDIETISSGDENALGLYGFGENAMEGLVSKAKQDCKDDPNCVAAQQGATAIDDEDDDDDPSDVDEESSDSEVESSDSEKSSPSTVEFSSATVTSSATATSSATIGSSSGTATSSAAVGSSSSGARSSSSAASSSSAGPGPARGICKASAVSIEKGGSVTWKATRMGGTFVTYDWTFSDGSSIASSKDSVPSVKYDKPGTYTATLVINKGTDTTSTDISCKVIVTGTKIEGCTCTNPDSSTTLFYKSGSPASSTWQVSGCKNKDGSTPTFTYAWSGDATGTGTSATGSFSKEGSFSPKVTVTNADGSTATPTCATVKTQQAMSATCNLGLYDYSINSTSMSVNPGQSLYFKPNSISGLKSSVSATFKGEGVSKTISIGYSNGQASVSATSFSAPTAFGTYTYTLSASGIDICSAKVTVAAPTTKCYLGPYSYQASSTTYSAVPGQKFYFKPDGSSWPSGSSNQTMTLTGGGTTKSITVAPNGNNSATELAAPSTTGTYSYDLSLNGTTVCSATLKVEYPKITGSCSLNPTTVVPGQSTTMSVGSGSWDANILGSDLSMTLTGTDGYSASVTANRYNSKSVSITPKTKEPGSYTYKVMYGDQTYCSSTLTIKKLLSCSVSSTSIKQGESFTFTTTAAGTCNSASTTVNGASFSSGCKSSQTITPEKAGTFKYKYAITGAYGKDSCEYTVSVAEITPTCAVSDMMRTKGTSFDVNPSSVIGCNNTDDGCSYSLTLSDDEKLGGTGYKGGKFTDQLVGETGTVGDTISAEYVLSLTNGTGTGTCRFTVAYIDTIDVNVTSSFKSYDAGKVYKVTRTSTSGESSFKCKANITSSKVAGVIGTTTLTIPNQYNSSNGLSLTTGDTYVFATDVNAPSGMTCGLSW